MSSPAVPTVLAVDGNSLLHRAFHASARTGFRLGDGTPAWAVRGFLSQLAAAVDRSHADAVVVGFDDPDASLRRERWPEYKAHRKPKPETLTQQLRLAREVLPDLGVRVVVPDGLEADDVLASVSAAAARQGVRAVLATSDRDAFALIDEHTRVLRILNGGVEASPLLDRARLPLVTGVRAEQYADLAALRGDASDNLPGVRGFGTKTAVRLLVALGTATAAFADAVDGGRRCTEAIGAARARTLATAEAWDRYRRNRTVMAMEAGVPLGERPLTEAGSVPLPEQLVRATYRRFDLGVRGPLRSLCLTDPPAGGPARVELPTWVSAAPAHRPPPLPAPTGPRYVQEALF